MKRKKLISAFTVVTLGMSMMVGTFNADAYEVKYEEVGETPGRVYVQTDRVYTLQELFDMSDEEFLSLDGINLGVFYAESYYNSAYFSAKNPEYKGFKGSFVTSEHEISYVGVPYKPEEIESKIKELLGDAVEYKIYSPASMSKEELKKHYMNYTDQISVIFPTYRSKSLEEAEAITDEKIMEYAKIYYCLSQLGHFCMQSFGTLGDGFISESEDIKQDLTENPNVTETEQITEATEEIKVIPTLKGDADLNGEVGISDVVLVSKYNASSTTYPLKNEIALANADMNNDDVVDGLDTAALIEYNLGRR